MRRLRLLKPLLHSVVLRTAISTPRISVAVNASCACSCSSPLALSTTNFVNIHIERGKHKKKGKDEKKENIELVADHRAIGTAQSLFTTHASSPGAPFFQPNGTRIFQKLVSFLRAQYPHFGFHEVLTPTIYKEALWEQSGHWANYKDDMFTVTGNPSKKVNEQLHQNVDGHMQPKRALKEISEQEEYGLKPMNCPGHCLLYQSERRSYRDLPIRYAEFSPLHRNEISGALSGLTRVRRFHQDDGHIFCRPIQVRKEIDECLAFIRLVYHTLNLQDYRLVLSTRPQTGYIGTVEEWDRAEDQLEAALNEQFGETWKREEGEGAFYGPKIDVILRGNDGKEHQTGTIQLDFQLPKRFDLLYDSPAPDMEAKGEDWKGSQLRTPLGKGTPVLIHRAILGSLERFMALLLEHYQGRLPFWLSPNQVIVLTVSDTEEIVSYAKEVRRQLLNEDHDDTLPKGLEPPMCVIDIDDSADTVAQKVVRAKKKNYNMICVVGQKNVSDTERRHGNTVDVDVSAQPDQKKTWSLIERVKPGSQAPFQKDRGTGASFRGHPGVRLNLTQCRQLISKFQQNYC